MDDIVTVSDEEIGEALVLLLERAKAVVEPAGVAGLAALLAGKVGGLRSGRWSCCRAATSTRSCSAS